MIMRQNRVFAALIYPAITSYKNELGKPPWCMPIQASLQTHAYVPIVKERTFVGDWLIAPLHRLRAVRRHGLHARRRAARLHDAARRPGFVQGVVKRAP